MAAKKKPEKAQGQAGQGLQEQKAQMPQRARASGRAMSPLEEMDRLFENFLPRGWLRPFRWEWPGWPERMQMSRMPRVDVIDREDDILVRAEIPGVKKEDLDVSLTDDTVTIRGTSRREEEEEKGQYHRRELEYGEFSRTVTLPAAVDTGKCKATFKEGILEMTLPKAEGAKRRTIRIEGE